MYCELMYCAYTMQIMQCYIRSLVSEFCCRLLLEFGAKERSWKTALQQSTKDRRRT